MTVSLVDSPEQHFMASLHGDDIEDMRVVTPDESGRKPFVWLGGRDRHGNSIGIYLFGESAERARQTLEAYREQTAKETAHA